RRRGPEEDLTRRAPNAARGPERGVAMTFDAKTFGATTFARRTVLGLAMALACNMGVASADDPPTGPTPPRLAYTDGDVAFWRTGAEDWTPAQTNTPLAEGDEVYAADGANVELQIGPRAFVRAGSDTQIGLETLDADTMQYEVNGGHAAFDVKRMPPGQ